MGDDFRDHRTSSEVAGLVRQDFELLVSTLSEQIQLIDDPDSDLLAALWKAKTAAERGLRLSELLEADLATRN
jgi:hypothetical protein